MNRAFVHPEEDLDTEEEHGEGIKKIQIKDGLYLIIISNITSLILTRYNTKHDVLIAGETRCMTPGNCLCSLYKLKTILKFKRYKNRRKLCGHTALAEFSSEHPHPSSSLGNPSSLTSTGSFGHMSTHSSTHPPHTYTNN